MKNYLNSLFEKAEDKLDYLKDIEPLFNVPSNTEHGDLSTNAALLLTRILKKNPREIAGEIISALSYEEEVIEKIEISRTWIYKLLFFT
ncbi:MAG: hypothetical protein U5K00_13090 [Melioribacteraceae bacterium]|nr:hypothetical protein [Melioribacteraceae bacterium]